jgi:hypothetical protein
MSPHPDIPVESYGEHLGSPLYPDAIARSQQYIPIVISETDPTKM